MSADKFAQAVQRQSNGDLGQAASLYLQVIAENPSHLAAHYNLAMIYKQRGELDKAAESLHQALLIDPTSGAVHFGLGNILVRQDRIDEAVHSFRQAIVWQPGHVEAHNNLGILLKDQGQLSEAAACFCRALELEPSHVAAHNNLGLVLLALGRREEAATSFRSALAANPQSADAHINLANTLAELGRLTEAAACYREAIARSPSNVDAWSNLGNVLREQGTAEEAIECYRQAVRIFPGAPGPHHNLSLVLKELGRLAEARQHNEQALRLDPAHRAALLQRSWLRLIEGDFAGGWEDYEHRFGPPNGEPRREFAEPLWDGADLAGKTILVYAEQGFGDTFHFARYLRLLKEEWHAEVVFLCQPALLPFCTCALSDVAKVVAAPPLPRFDVQVPLLSLPRLLHTSLETIHASVPYLAADPARIETWKRELSPLQGLRIGIAWQGNPKHPGDKRRSFSLAHFQSLADLAGINLISLQKGPGTEQVQSAPFRVLDLSDRLDRDGAFVDTAAIMMNLDLVITVDSAFAHLAGGLGVPVWVALSFAAEWRWLLGRSDNPWYPTMRLFRQPKLGAWTDVFEKMADALADRGAEASGSQ